ncbi:hypothetical protein KIN20_013232 [Parelaphostrongylus tenuis]|uniref:Uncharacterized protein n=1 Tax=Parelaphostrongylus tenuis TaxID=148309 RepID=A0AAD5QKX0_PARTN|nr:hypothetical protein KIN20_013232 [Parelaphostrongylus tenuis]
MPTDDSSPLASLPSFQSTENRASYPLLYVSQAGMISILLAHGIVIEMSNDRCVRVVCHGKFALYLLQAIVSPSSVTRGSCSQ